MDGIIETTVIVDLLRSYPLVLAWQRQNAHLKLVITPIIWMEIVQGADNKHNQTIAVRMLRRFDIIPMLSADMDWAMQQLEKFYLSHNVGMADCLIAAPAHRLALPLYTRNLKHFSAILPTLAQKPY